MDQSRPHVLTGPRVCLVIVSGVSSRRTMIDAGSAALPTGDLEAGNRWLFGAQKGQVDQHECAL